jgi:hypothetical protein
MRMTFIPRAKSRFFPKLLQDLSHVRALYEITKPSGAKIRPRDPVWATIVKLQGVSCPELVGTQHEIQDGSTKYLV